MSGGDDDLAARWDGNVPPDGELRGPVGDPWSDCPITPLGHNKGVFYFLDVVGQNRDLTARQLHHRGELVSLYLGDENYLWEHWPAVHRPRRNGDKPIITGFFIGPAASWHMQACRDAGIFGPRVVIRKPGIWPMDDGAVIVHFGDGMLTRRPNEPPKPTRCGRIGDVVYPASARRARPSHATVTSRSSCSKACSSYGAFARRAARSPFSG
jgi:hypothetical protein